MGAVHGLGGRSPLSPLPQAMLFGKVLFNFLTFRVPDQLRQAAVQLTLLLARCLRG